MLYNTITPIQYLLKGDKLKVKKYSFEDRSCILVRNVLPETYNNKKNTVYWFLRLNSVLIHRYD